MKKVLIASLALLAGCSTAYKGWQTVRIEQAKPSEECKYLLQETCSRPGNVCHVWFKKRSKRLGGNTVVFASLHGGAYSKGREWSSEGAALSKVDSGLGYTIIADYYDCPSNNSTISLD